MAKVTKKQKNARNKKQLDFLLQREFDAGFRNGSAEAVKEINNLPLQRFIGVLLKLAS